jgi:DNA-binding GntR family transcriptional regulator
MSTFNQYGGPRSSSLAYSLIPTLPLQIADRIGTEIIDERFRPGERLKEVVLAKSFGVSRATVREALRILENRRLVSIVPQRGAQVTNLSRKELEDMFEIRAALLGLASRRLALKRNRGAEDRLRTGLKVLEKSRRDAGAYARESANLALDIAGMSGNEQLVEHIALFAQRIGRYARMGLSTQARRDESLDSWKKLVRAIVAGDSDLADSIHRHLADRNRSAALEQLQRRENSENRARRELDALSEPAIAAPELRRRTNLP